jgi:hypothetical protein
MTYILLIVIVVLLAVLYAQKCKKNQEFFIGIPKERCYNNASSNINNGNSAYYTNFMLQTFGNFDKIFQYAKNKGIDALNALKQYKLDLEQASQIDAETRRVLSETSQRVQNVHDNLSDKIAESTNQYNAALANSKQILKRARSTAMTNADIKSDVLLSHVDSIIADNIRDEYKNQEKTVMGGNKLTQATYNVLENRTSTEGNIYSYQWQCEPGIIDTPIRINPNTGDVECYSTDGSNCARGFCLTKDPREIDSTKTRGVACSGAETIDPNNWCNKAAHTLQNDQTTDYSLCPDGWEVINPKNKICKAPAGYNGKATHNPSTGQWDDRCKGNAKCVMLAGYTPKDVEQWSKATNTFFPKKVSVVHKMAEMVNLHGQTDNIVKQVVGSGTPPSRIESYKFYKNGINVKAYSLLEGGNSSTAENYWHKGTVLFNKVISSGINYRVGSGTLMSLRPQYSNPNVDWNTDRVFLVFNGYIKIPRGVTNVVFRTLSDDGVRLKIKNTGAGDFQTVINNWSLHGDTYNQSNNIPVTSDSYIEFVLEFFENGGAATIVLEWDLDSRGIFQVITKEAFYIDTNVCSKGISEKSESKWTCVGDLVAPMRLNEAGDVECMSLNGRDCTWGGQCQSNITQFSESDKLNPLVCGDMHRQVWGSTGYEDPNMWCVKAKAALDPANQRQFTESDFGGRCGLIEGKKVKCNQGRCCNKYGWCGDSKFCGSGNQTEYNG